MIKRKGQSKKKKAPSNQVKNQRELYQSQPEKFLFSLTGGFLSTKSPTFGASTLITKQTKSGTVTPSNKICKGKENLYQTVFHSQKASQSITPFDYDKQLNDVKCRSDFRFLFQIGSGGFGRVWKIEQKKSGAVYAMKEMSKAKIITKKSVNSIINEKELLDQLDNPFIINSREYFQDRDNLYLVMEYLRGGDLRYHMCFYEYFDEQQTRFIVSCIILGLEYIHSCNIIHRDLKPENIVFEENGYARITDFGVARKRKDDNSEQTSGTPGYMAPEVICRMAHSFQADFFALGVIIYELIFGARPYLGDSRKEIREKILTHQVKISERQLPPGWSPYCIDFVNKLLKRNKQSRLGYNGISQLKSHPWLKSINWVKLAKKQVAPPFAPGVVCQSRQYQKQMQNTVPSEINEEAAMLLRTPQIQKLFKNYNHTPLKKVVAAKLHSPKIPLNTAAKFYKKVL